MAIIYTHTQTCLKNEGVLFLKAVKCVSLPATGWKGQVWEVRVAKRGGHTEGGADSTVRRVGGFCRGNFKKGREEVRIIDVNFNYIVDVGVHVKKEGFS